MKGGSFELCRLKVNPEKAIMNIYVDRLGLGEISDFLFLNDLKCNFLFFFSCPWVCLSVRLAMEEVCHSEMVSKF